MSDTTTSSSLVTSSLHDVHAFAQRKRHFDDFYAKAQSLPSISPYADEVSRRELEQWLAEQQAIERDVQDFDKGDLVRWRELARGAFFASS